MTPISDSASTDVLNVSNEPSTSLSSSSASQDTPAGSSTQRDLPPILSFNRQFLRGRKGHRWSTEPRSSIVGRSAAHNIMTSCTPGPSFSCEEILALIGILLLSGVNKDNHAATEEMFKPTMGIPAYRSGLSERRFCFLLRCIGFDDRATRDERQKEDPFAAVSQVFIDNCKHRYYPGENITIDEQLLAFRGRCGFRMYIPNKPAKYGLKVMLICDFESRYMLNAMPYLGKKTKPPDAVALGHYVAMELCKLCFGSKRNITGDNWFTSVSLVKKLLEKGLTYVGTIRKNKEEIREEMTDKTRFKPRQCAFRFDDNTTLLTRCCPNKSSKNLLPSFHQCIDTLIFMKRESRK